MPTLLETAELREAGIPEPWEFGVGDKVRFTELDPLGHVNNSKYFSWFEDFRLFYLPRFGLPMLAKDGARLVLTDQNVEVIGTTNVNSAGGRTVNPVAVTLSVVTSSGAVLGDFDVQLRRGQNVTFVARPDGAVVLENRFGPNIEG